MPTRLSSLLSFGVVLRGESLVLDRGGYTSDGPITDAMMLSMNRLEINRNVVSSLAVQRASATESDGGRSLGIQI